MDCVKVNGKEQHLKKWKYWNKSKDTLFADEIAIYLTKKLTGKLLEVLKGLTKVLDARLIFRNHYYAMKSNH